MLQRYVFPVRQALVAAVIVGAVPAAQGVARGSTPEGRVERAARQAAAPGKSKDVQVERDTRAERRRERKATQETRESRTFTIEGETTLSVSNLAGSITVAGGPGRDVRVEVVRRSFAPTDEDARRQIASTAVSMDQRGGRLDIRTRHGGGQNRVEVEFVITAPPHVLVDIRSLSGTITFRGLSGDARAETVSGDIVARDVAALSSAKTMSGDIELWSCGSPAEVAASSVSGGVNAVGLKARSCSFGSISGGVILKDVSCERAVVRTIAGDLTFAGPLGKGGRYEFKTHSGNVDLAVDGRTGFEMDARSFSGEMRSDLALKVPPTAEGSRQGRRVLQGVYGDGSAEITVTTFSGNISVVKK